ncbi:hypothetical protein FB45DRAFT_940656 [Roridomyces roridus]|uniref:Uncharacterized protein n=1 Tax=Roridomyces roridus TaxID=1738132 RepID=A0AAD7B5W8_9AGAR|nr:hypothetical protein FB45DRAFT_940656 [Roridomyces roridus]
MAPSLAGAELIEDFISSAMYGIYLVTLAMAGTALLTTKFGRLRRRAGINWILLVVSVVLFVNATLNYFLTITLTYDALVAYAYDGSGGADHILGHASGWKTFVKSVNVTLQTLIGGFILLYRCWSVYNKRWIVVVLPGIIWVADIACAIGILVHLARTQDGRINSGNGVDWGLSFWTLTICTNIASTSLIVWRIWHMERMNRKDGQQESVQSTDKSMLAQTMRSIVESGMIYTANSILQLAGFASGTTWVYIASAFAVSSVGITFNLIIIRGARQHVEVQDPPVSSIRFASARTSPTCTSDRAIASEHGDKANVFMLASLQEDSLP